MIIIAWISGDGRAGTDGVRAAPQFCVEDARRVPGARAPLGPMPNKGSQFELRCCSCCGARYERNTGNAGT